MSESSLSGRVLIIDDELTIQNLLKDLLEGQGYTVLTAEDGFTGLDLLKNETVDLVMLDVWMPRMGGIDVLKQLKKEWPDLDVIMVSGHADINLAVKAIKIGAYDFLEKPFQIDRVLQQVRNILHVKKLKKENLSLKRKLITRDEMIGTSAPMMAVRTIIEQSAGSDSRIFILGENGTGKELIARQIHYHSNRADGPFIEVNCAAIPDNLIESELFGHEKGSFTGAVARRKGKFESADGGTLFLDEVADMSLPAQAKLLRAVQEMRFERIGGEKTLEVDVRILSATNKDIMTEIAEGRFREDLYFRLNVIPVTAPLLKDRLDDLPLLIDYFLKKFNPRRKRTVSPEALLLMKSHSWPGNIREIKNFLERISVMSDEETFSADTIQFYLGEQTPKTRLSCLDAFRNLTLGEAKNHLEKQLLIEVLNNNSFNVSQSAQALGIYPSNLHSKIKKYGITR